MQSLIENFPMGILDSIKYNTYNSIFDFMIDVLHSCGISKKTIIEYLISKIYGVELDSFKDSNENNLIDSLSNNEDGIFASNFFINSIEIGIKSILMTFFTGILTCSAIPVIPNKMFDLDNLGNEKVKFMDQTLYNLIANGTIKSLTIPISSIDISGMLNVCPTSREGRVLYYTDSHDTYYKKTEETITKSIRATKFVNSGEAISIEKNKYDENIGISLMLSGNTSPFYLYFSIPSELNSYLDIYVEYVEKENDSVKQEKLTIQEGETKSNDFKVETATSGKYFKFTNFTIGNEKTKGGVVQKGEKNAWAYLSRNGSEQARTKWLNSGGIDFFNIEFGSENNETEIIQTYATESGYIECIEQIEHTGFVYEKCDEKDCGKKIERVDYVSENVTKDSPDYIVCYEGSNPSTLYRSYDMNAFIWYALNKGNKSNQTEYNHMMWDSRISAYKSGIIRESSEDWNSWYSSKSSSGSEFSYYETSGNSEANVLYPIMQFETISNNRNYLYVHIPSQRYYCPSRRTAIINNDALPKISFNSSLYEYDWDYLSNIKILNLKSMLYSLIKNLFGKTAYSLETLMDINPYKDIIIGRLKNAIKSIIKANDMNVEDCYSTFSNDDFNDMLNDMLKAKYNSDSNSKNTISDINSMLDSLNPASLKKGDITHIEKTVSIIETNGIDNGAVIETGLKVSFEEINILEELLMSITLSIIESLFTPQIMLLVAINFSLLGITNFEDFLGTDFSPIFNAIFNKILGFAKAIIIFVKDKIVSILYDLFVRTITPIIEKWGLLYFKEQLEYWLNLLKSSAECIYLIGFKNDKKLTAAIQDVDYADIYYNNEQSSPENNSDC